MFEEIREPIDALVIYRRGAPHPLLRTFRWKDRQYEVTETNLVHPKRAGEAVYLYYAVSCGRNHFHIRFDTTRNQWLVEGIDTSGQSRTG
jgi:hypothetical protein